MEKKREQWQVTDDNEQNSLQYLVLKEDVLVVVGFAATTHRFLPSFFSNSKKRKKIWMGRVNYTSFLTFVLLFSLPKYSMCDSSFSWIFSEFMHTFLICSAIQIVQLPWPLQASKVYNFILQHDSKVTALNWIRAFMVSPDKSWAQYREPKVPLLPVGHWN